MIAKSSRPFTEGQFVKECFLKASEILCPEKKKLFEGISLSPNTVASRITDLANDVKGQLSAIAKDFEAFSVALDESTDTIDTAQCAVFVRGVDRNLNVTEELLDLLPLKGTTTGRDIFRELEVCIENAGLQWDKLVSVATDGAPVMCSGNVGVVGLLKAKLKNMGASSNIVGIHCIVHQEALCGKSLKMKDVMEVVVKTVNFIRARGLNHRQFASFLSNMDSEYGELLYHTEVRWLSRGNVLKRFFALRDEIGLFMAMKDNDVPQLGDPTFLAYLAFLTDITEHLNTLNLKLQGPKQVITEMYDSIKAFKCKLSLWAKQLSSGNLAHFSALQSLNKVDQQCFREFTEIISSLCSEFDRRFTEFEKLEPEFTLFSTPFAVDVDCVPENLQMEVLELQCDSILKQKYMDVGVPEFYKYLQRQRFPTILSASARILAMFGSTYICEQFFSIMKINKSALRSRLTDEHLRATLRLAVSRDIRPNLDALLSGKRCQLSSKNEQRQN